jgi:hypothetical protein
MVAGVLGKKDARNRGREQGVRPNTPTELAAARILMYVKAIRSIRKK